jgi:hypothetical protein
VNSTSSVDIAIQNNASNATSGGTIRVPAVDGIATFSALTVNNVGSYTLTATSSVFATLGGAKGDNGSPAKIERGTPEISFFSRSW